MAANLDKSENALTNVTTVTYVRGIDASGNSVKISTANLASVLGAFKTQNQVTSGSANDCKDIGFYIIRTGVTDLPSPFLNTFATFVYTFSNGGAGTAGSPNSYIQIASNYAVEGIYIRKGYDNNWGAWSRADGFGFASFNELLSMIGVTYKDFINVVVDLNSIAELKKIIYAAVRGAQSGSTGFPDSSTNGDFVSFGTSAGFIELFQTATNVIYIRSKWGGGSYTVWRQL